MAKTIDIGAILKEMTSLDEARETPISLCVYIDETAPGDIQAQVRQAFASASVHARVSISYIEEGTVVAFPKHDMACIVAGYDPHIGSCVNTISQAGVPVMVVTTLPELVKKQAAEEGFPLSALDVIAPKDAPMKIEFDESAFDQKPEAASGLQAVLRRIPLKVSYPKDEAKDEQEPLALTPERAQSVSDAMGNWVLEACKQKSLAFAISFPFVRRPLSLQSVTATSIENGCIGCITILPGADLPMMTLNQIKMLLMIAAAHGETLDADRAKELAAVVFGAFSCRSIARSVVGVVPVLGWAIKGGIGFAGTQAMGRAAIDYYGGGEQFSRAMGSVAEARNKIIVSAAKKAVSSAQGKGVDAFDRLRAKAGRKQADSSAAVAES